MVDASLTFLSWIELLNWLVGFMLRVAALEVTVSSGWINIPSNLIFVFDLRRLGNH